MKAQNLFVQRVLVWVVIFVVVLGVGVLIGPVRVWSQATVKLGYVDMERVVNESQAGIVARHEFVAYMKKKKAEADKRKKDLMTMKQILQKQGALLSEDVRIQKEQEYQQKVREFQLFLKNMRDDARTKEMEMSKKIIRQVMKIVFSYAKENGYAMIFEKSRSGLLYAADSLDLTDTIIKIYNQEYSKKR